MLLNQQNEYNESCVKINAKEGWNQIKFKSSGVSLFTTNENETKTETHMNIEKGNHARNLQQCLKDTKTKVMTDINRELMVGPLVDARSPNAFLAHSRLQQSRISVFNPFSEKTLNKRSAVEDVKMYKKAWNQIQRTSSGSNPFIGIGETLSTKEKRILVRTIQQSLDGNKQVFEILKRY